MVTITLIAAVAENDVIGHAGDMPWRLPTDMKRFKAVTLGKPVIMGRKTLDSIGSVLPGRENIIVTRQQRLDYDDIHVSPSLDAALLHARERAAALGVDEIMIAGGSEIYRQSMPYADKLLITRVLTRPEGETRFPPIDPAEWQLVENKTFETGARDSAALRLETYSRKQTSRNGGERPATL